MKIYGLQKLTLLDYPGMTACTVFLGGCAFACPFCHNFELTDGSMKPLMDETELYAFLEKRRGKLDGVAITGGEPCLSEGLEDMMEKLHEMGFMVKLDTNGYHPDRLRGILERGLADYVAMDIKNSPRKYALTAGLSEERFDISRIETSIAAIMTAGVTYEFRTTVVSQLHEAPDFHEMGRMIKGAERYYLQPFVDRDTVPGRGFTAPVYEKLAEYASIVGEYVQSAEIRGATQDIVG